MKVSIAIFSFLTVFGSVACDRADFTAKAEAEPAEYYGTDDYGAMDAVDADDEDDSDCDSWEDDDDDERQEDSCECHEHEDDNDVDESGKLLAKGHTWYVGRDLVSFDESASNCAAMGARVPEFRSVQRALLLGLRDLGLFTAADDSIFWTENGAQISFASGEAVEDERSLAHSVCVGPVDPYSEKGAL